MIVRDWTEGLLALLRQTDHAHVSGELAARLADPPEPRSAFIAAARVHDNGWTEADAAPLLDPAAGRPRNYTDYPDDPYRSLWQRGIERAADVDPHVGLLVALHGGQFFRRHKTPEDARFHQWITARVDAHLADLGLDGSHDKLPPHIQQQFEHIRWLDGLSLFTCEAWDAPWESRLAGRRVEVSWRDGVALVDPWPFAGGDIEIALPAWTIPDSRYSDASDLARAWADAQRTSLRVGYARP